VAELLSGELLSQTLVRRGALPLGECLELWLQAAGGLQAAHELGWVHGKLSPDTILLTRTTEGRMLVKLIGFTPEFHQPRHAEPLNDRVSLGYASPERIAGHPPDEAGDVYSLGAVLHHLLIGVPPALPLKEVAGPEAMRDVLVRALAPSPTQRFQSVAEFVAALPPPLEAVVDQLPEQPKPGRRKLLPGL
jgi:serine/threonine protein kinase